MNHEYQISKNVCCIEEVTAFCRRIAELHKLQGDMPVRGESRFAEVIEEARSFLRQSDDAVKVAVLRVWFNGCCFAARLGQHRECPMCMKGRCSLQHWVHCPVVAEIMDLVGILPKF